jgi:hypothetical protein
LPELVADKSAVREAHLVPARSCRKICRSSRNREKKFPAARLSLIDSKIQQHRNMKI